MNSYHCVWYQLLSVLRLVLSIRWRRTSFTISRASHSKRSAQDPSLRKKKICWIHNKPVLRIRVRGYGPEFCPCELTWFSARRFKHELFQTHITTLYFFPVPFCICRFEFDYFTIRVLLFTLGLINACLLSFFHKMANCSRWRLVMLWTLIRA